MELIFKLKGAPRNFCVVLDVGRFYTDISSGAERGKFSNSNDP